MTISLDASFRGRRISTRPATDNDYEYLRLLHHETMRDSVERTWGWNDALQDDLFRRKYDPAAWQILLIGDRPVGAIAVSRRPNEIFIDNIQILPDVQAQGIGSAVLQSVLRTAQEQGLPVGLRVLKTNRARKLYERLGFEVTGETEVHYEMRRGTLSSKTLQRGMTMATSFQVVIDCADPASLSQFWADALGYILQPPPQGFHTWEDALRAYNIPQSEWNSMSAVVDPDGKYSRIFFQRVPERKTVKNRLHLDLNVTGGRSVPLEERRPKVDAEVQRLEELGATALGTHSHEDRGEYFVVMQDPEGNEFCVH